jgi:phosphate transport system substrate-binding protein
MKSLVGGLLVVGTLTAVVPATGMATEELKFAGSTTVMEVLEPIEDVFKSQGMHIQIQGNGSSAGVSSMRMGMAQVAMISRDPTPDESKDFHIYTAAKDIVVLIVNSANNMKNITSNEVRAIYSGEQKTWPNGGTVRVISKEAGRGTKVVFDEVFGLIGKIRSDAAIVGANGQTVTSVANDRNAIAYVSYATAHQAVVDGEPIRILALDGVEPTPKLVLNGSYKLGRSLNLLYKPTFQAQMERVIKVLQSPAAIQGMQHAGVVPTTGLSTAQR